MKSWTTGRWPFPSWKSKVCPRQGNIQCNICTWSNCRLQTQSSGPQQLPKRGARAHSSVLSLSAEDVLTDTRRIEQRVKQVQLGYNTPGYQRYIILIPKEERRKYHPRTPDCTKNIGKREFDSRVRNWRRALHAYDPDSGISEETLIKIGPPRDEKGIPLSVDDTVRDGFGGYTAVAKNAILLGSARNRHRYDHGKGANKKRLREEAPCTRGGGGRGETGGGLMPQFDGGVDVAEGADGFDGRPNNSHKRQRQEEGSERRRPRDHRNASHRIRSGERRNVSSTHHHHQKQRIDRTSESYHDLDQELAGGVSTCPEFQPRFQTEGRHGRRPDGDDDQNTGRRHLIRYSPDTARAKDAEKEHGEWVYEEVADGGDRPPS